MPIDEIYDMLETEEGVDRAFAKLDTIKDSLVFWTRGCNRRPQLLADQEVFLRHGPQWPHLRRPEVENQRLQHHLGRSDRRVGRLGHPAGGDNQEAVLEYVRWGASRHAAPCRPGQVHLVRPGPCVVRPLVVSMPILGIDMKAHMPSYEDNYQAPIVAQQRVWTDLRR